MQTSFPYWSYGKKVSWHPTHILPCPMWTEDWTWCEKPGRPQEKQFVSMCPKLVWPWSGEAWCAGCHSPFVSWASTPSGRVGQHCSCSSTISQPRPQSLVCARDVGICIAPRTSVIGGRLNNTPFYQQATEIGPAVPGHTICHPHKWSLGHLVCPAPQFPPAVHLCSRDRGCIK